MPKPPYEAPVIEGVPAQTVATKAKDDIVIVRRKGWPIEQSWVFTRAANGDLLLTWWDPSFEAISLGSAKERRARFAQAERQRKRSTALKRRRHRSSSSA
jgi:hypothetical protein